MARPTKYTPETTKKITDAIRVGATFRLACLYGGISEETFMRWRERYVDFADAINEAEGAGAIGWLAKIEKAANDGNWQAAAWKLERKYPREYGRRVINSYEDTPVEKVPELSDDDLEQLYKQLVPSRRG